MPTLNELKTLNPGMSAQQIMSLAAQDGIALDKEPAAPAANSTQPPSWAQRFKDIATSGPALKTAGTMVGEIGAGLLAPETGGLSLAIPPALAALGSVTGGALSRSLHGESGTAGDFATDAMEGLGGHYAGPLLNKLGKGAAYVRDLVPKTMRLGGYALGQMTHPSIGSAVGEIGTEAGPEALQGAGNMITRGRNWLQGLGKSAAGDVEETAAIPRKTPLNARGRGLTNETPYRMGGSTQPVAGEPNIMSETRNAAQPPASYRALMDESGATAKPPVESSKFPTRATEDMMGNQGGLDFMHQEFSRNNPVFERMAEQGEFGQASKGEALTKRGAFNSQTPHVMEAGPSSAGQVAPGAADVDAMLEQLGLGRESPMMSAHTPTASTVRPPNSFVHSADTTGAKFGFPSLPEISEGELSRLQALMGRMGR